MKILFRLSLFIFILLVGIATYCRLPYVLQAAAQSHGGVAGCGLQQSVDVHWDPYGVPYIYADTDSDLYFTVGYLHAQDRLWQLTLAQMMSEGRFSEFLGDSFIEIDKHQRTLGIWRTAESIIGETSPQILSISLKAMRRHQPMWLKTDASFPLR